jgi:hypothetical protein
MSDGAFIRLIGKALEAAKAADPENFGELHLDADNTYDFHTLSICDGVRCIYINSDDVDHDD